MKKAATKEESIPRSLPEALRMDPRRVTDFSLRGNGGPIPPDLLKLKHLRSLILECFNGEGLSDVLKELPRLTFLRLDKLSLTELPESLFHLPALETLCLEALPLKSLSPQMGRLKTLILISINRTDLQTVPKELFRLPHLEHLDLSFNKLTSLPEEIESAKSLKTIRIRGNDFARLPTFLSRIENVDAETKVKALYRDVSYPSKSKKPIQQNLFTASHDLPFMKRLKSEMKNVGLGSYGEELLGTARKSVIFTTTPQDDKPAKDLTRFGGAPDLPPTLEYPMTEGKLWVFLAQIDLGSIASLQDYLPREGILYFFAEDLGEPENVKVFYHPSKKDLTRYAYPEGVEFYDADTTDPFIGCQAVGGRGASLPYLYSDEYRLAPDAARLLEIQQSSKLSDAYRKLWKWVCPQEDTHGMNTYVFTQHESPEEQAAEKMGGYPEEWMVLLSLASDPNPDFCFWDAGTLTFTIHKKDLQAGDFSRVLAFIESS